MTSALAKPFKVEQTKALTTTGAVKGLLDTMKGTIAAALPKHLTPERVCKAALLAVNKSPKLLECNQGSFIKSIMEAASLGLDCSGGALGQGYLIPYGRDCTFIPGYRGLIDLARRGGDVATIEARVVYEGDEFNVALGLEPKLEHVPSDEENPDKIIAVYAIAMLRDKSKQFEVMTRKQVDAIRAGSKAGRSGPWVNHYAEMARKTVVRRLIKYLPLSSELLSAAIDMSDREYKDDISMDVQVEQTDPLKPGRRKVKRVENESTPAREPGDDE